jgi:putative lipoprotein
MRLSRFIALAALTSFYLSCTPTQRDMPADSQLAADSPTPAIDTSLRPQPASVPWEDARRRGVEFRAIGQEPGWMLEIDREKSIYLLADYGEKKVTMPVPTPRDSAGTTIYDTRTEAHRLTVRIRPSVCHDSMSGEEMTHTVTVTLDGTEYRGCGRDLTTRS